MRYRGWQPSTIFLVAMIFFKIDPANAQSDSVSLKCEGELMVLASKPGNSAPMPGISAEIKGNKLTIGSSGFFDGTYSVTLTKGNSVMFDKIGVADSQHRSIFIDLDRISGSIVMMDITWSDLNKTGLLNINAWISGRCQKSDALF